MSQAVIGVRTAGASHKRIKKECQDYCEDREFNGETFILAVADGHGSEASKYSADGSKQATKALIKILSDLYIDFKMHRNS